MRSSAAHPFRLAVVVCLFWAIPGGVFADTIYLKSGRKITATHVVQEDGQVGYDTPAGRFSFPLSIVDRVVHDDSSPISTAGTPADRAANIPIAPPAGLASPSKDAAASAAVRDGSIDSDLLSKLESEATANPTPPAVARVVEAEIAAAQFEITVGDFEGALAHYNTGLRFDPDNVGLLLGAAYLHLRRSEYSLAEDLLDHARRIDPDSVEVAKLSGWAYYGLESSRRRRHAMETRLGAEARRRNPKSP